MINKKLPPVKPRGRPKKAAGEKLRALTFYLPPEAMDELKAWAERDHRTLSAMASFMVQHALKCHLFKQGHVPAP